MTRILAEIWTCDACNGVEEIEVVVAPSFLPPPGWGSRDGADLCIDCLIERNRQYGGGGRG